MAPPRTAVPERDGITDVAEDIYHADRGSLSVSGAKLLLPPSCPEKFKYRLDNPPKPKKIFDEGHLAHKKVLGKGGEFMVLDPAVHGLKADGSPSDKPTATAMWKAHEAEARAAGMTPIHIDIDRNASLMADRVLNDPDAGPLFKRGHAERALYWTDPATRVRLRGRPDWLTLQRFGDSERLVCVDYKTSITANPAELERKFWQLHYYMQAAWYLDLLIALKISDNPVFLFVVQEKEPPHIVTVIEYDAPAIAKGRRANRRAIELYAQCRETDEWPAYARGVVSMSLPHYAFTAPTIADLLDDEID
ncbi:PD-(D/E)XK nuclease-like domain-containing protein [Mycolicibacterium vanbaalenii]|nr:PD-(D/E)XK nuclease-like domain-containing protein [Mycolicibacterium vanbaalenii]